MGIPTVPTLKMSSAKKYLRSSPSPREPTGTAVYLDGALVKNTSLRLSTSALQGRLVLGTSPVDNDNWTGRLLGLAIYNQALLPAQVLRHYQSWTQKGRPAIEDGDHNRAVYLFTERTGRIAHDSGSAGINLTIPEEYVILDEKFLEPFWQEFSLRWSYWKSAFINVVGFIPLGFFFCAYLTAAGKTGRPGLVTIVVGTTVSLTIEVLQSYLPTRDSGTTDLITNTMGTVLGVILFRWRPGIVNKVLDRIPFERILPTWAAGK